MAVAEEYVICGVGKDFCMEEVGCEFKEAEGCEFAVDCLFNVLLVCGVIDFGDVCFGFACPNFAVAVVTFGQFLKCFCGEEAVEYFFQVNEDDSTDGILCCIICGWHGNDSIGDGVKCVGDFFCCGRVFCEGETGEVKGSVVFDGPFLGGLFGHGPEFFTMCDFAGKEVHDLVVGEWLWAMFIEVAGFVFCVCVSLEFGISDVPNLVKVVVWFPVFRVAFNTAVAKEGCCGRFVSFVGSGVVDAGLWVLFLIGRSCGGFACFWRFMGWRIGCFWGLGASS